MSRVYLCLTTQHDLKLVAVAVLVALLSSWTTLRLADRGFAYGPVQGRHWILAAGVIAGCGVWATHFLAMLAYHPDMQVEYDLLNTLVSIAVAVIGCTLALTVAALDIPARLWWSGIALGMAVGAMHYTGQDAVRVPAIVTWDSGLVLLSLVLGSSLAGVAMTVSFGSASVGRRLLGASLLAVSIAVLHFIGMGALILQPLMSAVAPAQLLPHWVLAVAVAAVAAAILLTALAALTLDSHLSTRVALEAQRLRTLVDATFEGILIYADGVVLDANESLLTLLGYSRAELIGLPIDQLAPAERRAWVADVETRAGQGAVETEFLRKDGGTASVEVLGRLIDYQQTPAHVLAVRDTAERRASEERIHHLAYHDALTDLPNRRLLREHLGLALGRVQPSRPCALLCLDLDRFKVVNDTLGHPAGDRVLLAVADRLREAVRSTDIVARLGGDEFAVVQAAATQPESATTLSRRLVAKLSEPFDLDGQQVMIGVSIGVAIASEPGFSADDLMKSADMALYQAKSDGKGTWRFYESNMDTTMQARRMLELDLRQALALDQFEVNYQPLVDMQTTRITGFEALLRWRHPERGMVSPATFIPLAEEIGLISQIGRWVLYQVCTDAVLWPESLEVAVNLSPAQFGSTSLAEEIGQILTETGLAPSRLQLEVTESLLLGDQPSVLTTMHALRDLGIRIAMDDFGTGYSSLSYLRQFPFDKLKIDQSFVRNMHESEDGSAIVRAIAGLGRSLGMTVNAEGVETEKELEALRSQSCDEVQGYLFSKPVPRSAVPDLIARYGCTDQAPTMPPTAEETSPALQTPTSVSTPIPALVR